MDVMGTFPEGTLPVRVVDKSTNTYKIGKYVSFMLYTTYTCIPYVAYKQLHYMSHVIVYAPAWGSYFIFIHV